MKYVFLILLFSSCQYKSYKKDKIVLINEIVELRKQNKFLAEQLIIYTKTHQEVYFKYRRNLAHKDSVISYLSHKKNVSRKVQKNGDY